MPLTKHTYEGRNRWLNDVEKNAPENLVGEVYCEGQDERQAVRYYVNPNPHRPGACRDHHWASGRCHHKGRFDFEGIPFCGVHYPPKRFAKILARVEQDRIESVARRYRDDRGTWSLKRDRRMIKALEEIAADTLNDPVGYAQLVIQELNDAEPSKPVEAHEYDRQREADRRRREEARAAETRSRRNEQGDQGPGRAQETDEAAK